MGFACPRCRGAKSKVEQLHELPEGAHCASCNIDYQRDFTRNVELTFHPEPWLRRCRRASCACSDKARRRMCKFQAEVAAHSEKNFALTLPPGPYRFRTVEAGRQADANIGDDGGDPRDRRAATRTCAADPGRHGEFAIHNETDRPMILRDRGPGLGEGRVDRRARHRHAGIPAAVPRAALRPGDEVEIGRVAIVFTDLQGSTKLYDQLGDAAAYRLVRDHFAFLSERVARHHGFIVKTVGDAVMAAFHDPADAVRAVLSMQDEVGKLQSRPQRWRHRAQARLHLGACIAVTAGDVLDYFGSAVNTASRLEHQCRGGEVIISQAVLHRPGSARDAGRASISPRIARHCAA